jgi:acetolactate synthase regulatory subunit
LSEFKKKLTELNNLDIVFPVNILEKKKNLIETYNCFNIKYDPRSVWEKKKFKNTNRYYETKNKLYTFTTNNDNITKQNLTSLLNKLSDTNKIKIMEKIDTIIESNINKLDELFNDIFKYIEKLYDIKYIEIIKKFEKYNSNIIINYLDDYIINKKWIIDIKNNIMDDNNYDEFCNYNKLKNKQINIIKSFCFLHKTEYNKYDKQYNNLCNLIFDEFKTNYENNNFKYIIDYLLELLGILSFNRLSTNITEYFQLFNLKKINNSTKFLILNIIENSN